MTGDPKNNNLIGCLPALLMAVAVFAPELLILLAGVIRFASFRT